jgi:hypothetical protein
VKPRTWVLPKFPSVLRDVTVLRARAQNSALRRRSGITELTDIHQPTVALLF